MTESLQELSADDVVASLKHFDSVDYAVFSFMLVACSCVGLYFGYQHHKQTKNRGSEGAKIGSEAIDYLLGGKNVQMFPVAMSLVASYFSGISLLGTSTEIYVYGTQYVFFLAGPAMMGVFMHYILIPVFYDLQVVSMFERRFDMKIRLFGSIISSVATLLWLPIVIYVPALAFNQTTGINVHVITPVVVAVCMFYTCLGGIKAVIWTDVVQVLIIYGVMILIFVKGTLNAGGLGMVIERNWESGRIEAPDFDIDPTIRHSFWTLFVGGSWFCIIINTDQMNVQRFLSLNNQNAAKKASAIFAISSVILSAMCMYNGLLLYATYHDCDPLTTKLAKAKDQLIPLFVMQTFKDIPGLPGLFIAGIFSAALSSLSSAFNAMAAIVLEDYAKPIFKDRLTEKASAIIMRGTVLVIGFLSLALVYVVENMGSVLQLSMSVPPSCIGGLFGIFTIGMFLPWIGKKATFYGALIASVIMIYVVIRSQLDIAAGFVRFDTKVTSVEGCTYNFTIADHQQPSSRPDPFEKSFHHISYLYYMPLGALITCTSAFFLSLIFGFEDPSNVDPQLLAPLVRKYFKPIVIEVKNDILEMTHM